MPKLTIIILSWNTGKLLEACLNSLKFNLKCETIVVDNGSTDGSPEMLKKDFPKVKLIKNNENLGFAKGNNIGIKEAQGEYIMLLNSDTIVQEGAIERLVGFLDTHQEAVGVSPLILNVDGSIQKDPCFLKFPSPVTVLLYYNPILRKLFLAGLLSTNNFEKPGVIDQLSGAAVMVRADILKKIDGFDEAYPHFFEDTDLSYRLSKLGKFFLVPASKVVHLGGRSLQPVIKKEGLEKFYYLNFYGLFLFCRKNYSLLKYLLIKFVVFGQLFFTGKFSLINKLK